MTFTSDEHFQREFPITDPKMNVVRAIERQLWVKGDIADKKEGQFSRGSVAKPRSLASPISEQQTNPEMPAVTHSSHDFVSTLSTPKGDLQANAIRLHLRARETARLRERENLIQAVSNPSASIRAAAIEELGTLGKHAPIDILIQALQDDSFWDVRAAAAQALGLLENDTPIKELVSAFRDEEDESVQEAIIRALGKQGKRAPIEFLLGVLHSDNNWLVRSAAAWALGELGTRVPLKPLIQVLHLDSDEMVQAAAARALGRLGNKLAAAALFEALSDEEVAVRDAAAWALQQLDQETRGLPYRKRTYDLLESDNIKVPASKHYNTSTNSRRHVLSVLKEFAKDKKGYVHQSQLFETTHGQTLLLDCRYQHTEHSLPDAVRQSLQDTTLIQPLEAAFDGQDDVVKSVIAQTVDDWDHRHWQELFVVSFALSHSATWGEPSPLRVIVTGVGYSQVRKTDPAMLEQITTIWSQAIKTSTVCQQTQDLLDLKIWYQPVDETPTPQFV